MIIIPIPVLTRALDKAAEALLKTEFVQTRIKAFELTKEQLAKFISDNQSNIRMPQTETTIEYMELLPDNYRRVNRFDIYENMKMNLIQVKKEIAELNGEMK